MAAKNDNGLQVTRAATITPTSLDEVARFARMAFNSGLTPHRNVEQTAMVLMTGMELGLSPMQSLRGVYVVQDKPMVAASTLVAVVRASGLCESWRVVESTVERCTIITRRLGEQHDETCTWTREDATRAGLASKGTWKQFPAQMLLHRTEADLARRVYPDAAMGIASLYTPEEFGADVSTTQPAQPAEITPATLDGLGIEAQPRQIESRRDGADIPHAVRVRAKDLAGQNPDLGEWQRAVDEADGESRDIADDLRAQASRAESLPALAGLWVAAKADVAALDDRDAQARVWAAFKARAKDLGATVKALQAEIERQSQPTPPDGTSGPRRASNDTVAAEGGGEASAGAAGPVASVQRVESLEAVAERAANDPRLAAVRDHIARKTARPALINSVRAHWSEVLADSDVRDLYAGRLRATTGAVSGDPRSDDEKDRDARALVTTWAEAARAEAESTKGKAA